MKTPEAQQHAARSEAAVDVAVFHRIIHAATSGDSDIATLLRRHFGYSADAPLHHEDWVRLEADFSVAYGDMDAEHAARLASHTFSELRRPPCPATMRSLVERIECVYRQIGAEFADLLIGFVHSALATSRRHEASETVFLARDAVPFYVIAQTLATRGIARQPASLLDFNRSMIPAFPASSMRLSGDSGALVTRYLAARFAARERVAIVDTGLYGTLIQAALEMRLFEQPIVLFFASKNPNIFGYLNATAGPNATGSTALDAFGEACCDAVETWPKLYTPSELHRDGSEVHAISRPTDLVSSVASLALYRALAHRARSVDLETLDPRNASLPALAEPLPRWEHAGAWLATWRAGPIAPVD